MKFPITREQLQNVKKEVEEDVLQHNIDLIISLMKEQIVAHAYEPRPPHLGGISTRTFKINLSEYDRFHINIPNRSLQNSQSLSCLRPWKTHLGVIIEKLFNLFPQVTFEIDPLKTYILVDWS